MKWKGKVNESSESENLYYTQNLNQSNPFTYLLIVLECLGRSKNSSSSSSSPPSPKLLQEIPIGNRKMGNGRGH